MKIDRSELSVKQMPEKKSAAGSPEAEKNHTRQATRTTHPEDAIQISHEARNLQARLEAAHLEEQGLGSSTARVDEAAASVPQSQHLQQVRSRVENGFYEDPEVTKLVAERLLGTLGFRPGPGEAPAKKGA